MVGTLLGVALVLGVTAPAGATGPAPASPAALVDTLAGARSTDVFRGSGEGYTIAYLEGTDHELAFVLSLTRPTVITEIGGFANCGFPRPCTPNPLAVDVRASVGNVPGSEVLGSYVMSDDGDQETVSYETASPRLLLAAGNYFVLLRVREHGRNDAYLLGNLYRSPCCADLIYHAAFPRGFGDFNNGTYRPFGDRQLGGAVRVLGRPLPIGASDCKDHNWRAYGDNHGDAFENQGRCMVFVIRRLGA
jgi:hypothetical protein